MIYNYVSLQYHGTVNQSNGENTKIVIWMDSAFMCHQIFRDCLRKLIFPVWFFPVSLVKTIFSGNIHAVSLLCQQVSYSNLQLYFLQNPLTTLCLCALLVENQLLMVYSFVCICHNTASWLCRIA